MIILTESLKSDTPRRAIALAAALLVLTAISCGAPAQDLPQVRTLFAQDPPQFGTPFAGVPDRMDANIYQLNLREYSSSRDIAGARQKLQRIKDLGINMIYLMPIYPLGVANNDAGSPYSIRDLKGIAADLGTLSDLRGLVEDAHNLGMSIILDMVVNQTSWDQSWITEHPSWYVHDNSGSIVSPCPAPNFCFTDVAAMNLDNSEAAAAMIEAMRYWIFSANVDGYRFDWADQAPQAFWTAAIANLRGIKSHRLLLLAEGSNEGTTSGCTTCGQNQPGAHYAQGFDYIFGTNFYWNVMKKIWNAGEPVTDLDGVTAGEYAGASPTQLVARYLSNHDDYNSDGSPFSYLNGGRNAVMGAFVVAAYQRGVPFIYNGIEVGNTSSLSFPWNSGNINWTQDLSVYTEMQRILGVRDASVALRRGTPVSYIDPANTNPDVIAFTKSADTEKVVVLVNVRNGPRSFTIPAGMAGSYVDAYNGASITLTSGARQDLSAFQYLVLTNTNAPVVRVTGVSVNPGSATINAGLTAQMTASLEPPSATNHNVIWLSSNSSVATVNESGLVTAIAAGTASITVTTQDGNHTAIATITVRPSTHFTVHFYRPPTWNTGIKIYWWGAQPAGVLTDASWPGTAMIDEGGNWYRYTFTNVTSTNLIFNDGSNQTADLFRDSEGWYQNGSWYATNPGTPPISVYRIKNRWQDTYLYDHGDRLAYGNPPADDQTSYWQLENVDGYIMIKNVATGDYVNIENLQSYVECTNVPVSFWSAHWALESYDGYTRFRNRWRSGDYMHIENLTSYVQHGLLFAGSFSSHWSLEPVTSFQPLVSRAR